MIILFTLFDHFIARESLDIACDESFLKKKKKRLVFKYIITHQTLFSIHSIHVVCSSFSVTVKANTKIL